MGCLVVVAVSVEPFTRREERDDLLAFSRMWASDGNEDGWLRSYAASVIRLEATVQAETARADAAEERAERLAELLRLFRPQLSDVDVRVVDEALADDQAGEER